MLKLTPVPRTSCPWEVALDTVEAGRETVVGGKLMKAEKCMAVVSFGELKSNWKREGEL